MRGARTGGGGGGGARGCGEERRGAEKSGGEGRGAEGKGERSGGGLSPSALPRPRPPAGRCGCAWPCAGGDGCVMAQRGQPAPHAMAAKEELYSKVIPRRNRQHRAGTIKHGSSLEILLSMGFPKARA